MATALPGGACPALACLLNRWAGSKTGKLRGGPRKPWGLGGLETQGSVDPRTQRNWVPRIQVPGDLDTSTHIYIYIDIPLYSISRMIPK